MADDRRLSRTPMSRCSSLIARSLAVAALLQGATAGCRGTAPVLYQVEPVPAVVGCAAGGSCGDVVEITYLGVAGFVIRRGAAIVLTGPSFTNPPLDAVAPAFFGFRRAARPIHPDTVAIERLLPRAADSASLLLVGHGHYDHALDVPYIASRRATRATIYTGPTVRHMLMGDSILRADSGRRVVGVERAEAGTVERTGRWFYAPDSSVRVMALVAEHAPTLRLFRWGPMFAAGTLDRDLSALPARAGDWKLGEPYAFLIDFLARGDTTTPRFRVYFQDAPSEPPAGFPPASLASAGAKGIDVALLCVATARNVRYTPDSLLAVLRPRYVVAGHWESFFRQQTLPLELNPASDVEAFLTALGARLPPRSGWVMPTPRTTIRVAEEASW